jgi:flagellar export protein FliJ
MKSLPTLIKLAEQKLEAQQQRIAEVEQKITELKHAQENLKQRVADGFIFAATANEPVIHGAAAAFAKRSKEDLTTYANTQTKAEQQMDVLQTELRGLFAEKKKNEVLLATYQRRRRETLQKKQQAELDDIANTRASRR